MTAPLTDRLRALAERLKERATYRSNPTLADAERADAATIEAAMRVIEAARSAHKLTDIGGGAYDNEQTLIQMRGILGSALAAPEGGARG